MHHGIEERHIFPVLARKMPKFRKDIESGKMIEQHKVIHKGIDEMNEYFAECQTGVRELRLEQLKEIMDKFGETLWQHLDEEVKELGAENMRKYWKLEELRQIPF
jgi:hemerythrin-like domain-containing protein